MAITIPGTVTGSAQTGLTSPTYTVTANQSPDLSTKQVAVTALGGTQTGVTTHSMSSPFTLSVSVPRVVKILGPINPSTGVISSVPNNNFRIVTKKGVMPATNQQPRLFTIDSTLSVPAGSDTFDAANIRAALSAHIGLLQQISAGLGDTAVTGIL